MTALFDLSAWRDAAIRALNGVMEGAIIFVPKILAALVLTLLGWLLARFLRAATRRVLARLGMDAVARRIGVSEPLTRALGPRPPSELVSVVVYWAVVIFFLSTAINALGLQSVTSTFDRLVEFLPRVFGAAAIIILGVLMGGLTRNLVASGAALGTLEHGSRLGAASNLLVIGVAAVLAVEQLGINTQLLVALATAVVAAVTLTVGAAFALGARSVVGHVLAGHFLRERLPVGESVEVDGFSGTVERVGAVDTLLRDGERTLSIPNAVLLERSVRR